MNPVKYLKEHGVKRAFTVIYEYKLDHVISKLMSPFLKHRKLQDIIVIESHNDFDSNGGAFYNYLIKQRYNKRYKIVWLIKHPEYVPKELPENVTWVPIFKPSFKKNYYLWVCKYISCDEQMIDKNRKDQKSIYLTHGSVGLKKVTGLINLPESTDYILTASEFFAPLDAEQYGISFPDARFKVEGFPIDDVLYDPSYGDLKKVTKKSYKKVILWMPTFRKGQGYDRNDSDKDQKLGIPIFSSMSDFEKFNGWLNDSNTLLIIKIHPKQDLASLRIHSLSNIIVLTGDDVKKLRVDNYRLMKDVDAIISDYSSAVYDFLHLNRPVAFDFSDLKDYRLGIILDNPEKMIAGDIIYNKHDLEHFITSVIAGEDRNAEKRKEVFDLCYKYHDGNSCKRIAELLEL